MTRNERHALTMIFNSATSRSARTTEARFRGALRLSGGDVRLFGLPSFDGSRLAVLLIHAKYDPMLAIGPGEQWRASAVALERCNLKMSTPTQYITARAVDLDNVNRLLPLTHGAMRDALLEVVRYIA